MIDEMTKGMDAKMTEIRRDLLAPIGSLTSHDPQLRKEGAVKVLEIGVGTGKLSLYLSVSLYIKATCHYLPSSSSMSIHLLKNISFYIFKGSQKCLPTLFRGNPNLLLLC